MKRTYKRSAGVLEVVGGPPPYNGNVDYQLTYHIPREMQRSTGWLMQRNATVLLSHVVYSPEGYEQKCHPNLAATRTRTLTEATEMPY